jgi:cellulose synthase/poly-beta-1,6-N-acetylglucosamine synthase-like glycosyltransferase
LVLVSADLILEPDVLPKILRAFNNPKVGLAGCKVIPLNQERGFCTKIAKLIWDLHDSIGKFDPKLGEIIAFRRSLIDQLPEGTVTDEAFIEAIVRREGYSVEYVNGAIVHNKGPETLRELFEQRRRVFVGHLQTQRRFGYTVSTMKLENLLKLLSVFAFQVNPLLLLTSIFLEASARISAWFDFIARKDESTWAVLRSTKLLPKYELGIPHTAAPDLNGRTADLNAQVPDH